MDFHTWVENLFPNLRGSNEYIETSPCTDEYNCIAFAADDFDNWWWPHQDSYWPHSIPYEETLDAFIEAYRTIRYETCADGVPEPDFEKIVIYVDSNSKPTHAAKQTESGSWKSKLGKMWDIEHRTTEGIEGTLYGNGLQFLRRKKRKSDL